MSNPNIPEPVSISPVQAGLASSFDEDAGPPPLLSRVADAIVGFITSFVHLAWIALIGVILASVILRYFIGYSLVWLEELQWHIFGAGFMIGLSYALVHDEHVRVDILASGWKVKTRAWVEIACMLLLVAPFAAVIAYNAIPFVEFSHRVNEISGSPGGLKFRWIIKAFLPFAMSLLCLAALARALKMAAIIWRKKPQAV